MSQSSHFDDTYPVELREEERKAINARRRQAGVNSQLGDNQSDDRVGLALSGGGIRSATFALGVLQALSRYKLLRHVDFLSTVSGGGYVGAFLGRLFTRLAIDKRDEFRAGLAQKINAKPEELPTNDVALVEAVVADSSSPPLNWLRENGRYLSPNGSGDTLMGISVALRNWFAARVVLWMLLLMLFVQINTMRALLAGLGESPVASATEDGPKDTRNGPPRAAYEQEQDWAALLSDVAMGHPSLLARWTLWWSPFVLLLPLLLIFAVVPTAWGYWLFPLVDHRGVGTLTPRYHIMLLVVLLVAPRIVQEMQGRAASYFGVMILLAVVAALVFAVTFVDQIKSMGTRTCIHWLVCSIALLIAAGTIAFPMMPLHIQQWLSGGIVTPTSPWPPAEHSFFGLVGAMLVVLLAAAIVQCAYQPPFEGIAPSGARESLTVGLLIFVGLLSWLLISDKAASSGNLVAAFWPTFADMLCVVGLLTLLRGVLPKSRLPLQFDRGLHGGLVVMTVLVTLVYPWTLAEMGGGVANLQAICGGIAFMGGLSLIVMTVISCRANLYVQRRSGPAGYSEKWVDNPAFEDVIQKGTHNLTALLRNVLMVLAAVAVFVLIDTCGQSLYSIYQSAENRLSGSGLRAIGMSLLIVGGSTLGLVAASKKLASLLLGSGGDRRIKLRFELLALLVALPLLATELVAINAISHGFAWGWTVPAGDPGETIAHSVIEDIAAADHNNGAPNTSQNRMSLAWLIIGSVVLFFAAWGQGQLVMLLNRSTLNPLYAARLTRAYLGASNPKRWDGPDGAVTNVVQGDSAGLEEYLPNSVGGPLHLVNVTLNETASGRSQIEQRDRKGLSLAFGPLSASIHRRHHAFWRDAATDKRAFDLQLQDMDERITQVHLGMLLDDFDLYSALHSRQMQLCEATRDRLRSTLTALQDELERGGWKPLPNDSRTCIQQAHSLFSFPYPNDAATIIDAIRGRANEVQIDLLKRRRFRQLVLDPIESQSGDGFRVFEHSQESPHRIPCEDIPVALAMSISGAAFTTGLGARTSFGVSLLCGLLNIRLGYWWNSGVNPNDRKGSTEPDFLSWMEWQFSRVFPVQATLVQEFTARFHGPARRHWYLSDGGHFENMGAYELIRRRVPWIIICDAEADPDYTFDGMAKLVRTARIDFDAEVKFLSEPELDVLLDPELRPHFGTMAQLRRGRWTEEAAEDPHPPPGRKRLSVDGAREALALRHATLAWITYSSHNDKRAAVGSLLIYIKPTLNGDEPEDVLQYHADHPDFPHETTADQYFDEAQWESYRRLGLHIGEKLFAHPDGSITVPRRWLNGLDRVTPASLFVYVQMMTALNERPDDDAHSDDPTGDWRVCEQWLEGGHYLLIENCESRRLSYVFHEKWLNNFSDARIILWNDHNGWRGARADAQRIQGSVSVPPGGRVILQAK